MPYFFNEYKLQQDIACETDIWELSDWLYILISAVSLIYSEHFQYTAIVHIIIMYRMILIISNYKHVLHLM